MEVPALNDGPQGLIADDYVLCPWTTSTDEEVRSLIFSSTKTNARAVFRKNCVRPSLVPKARQYLLPRAVQTHDEKKRMSRWRFLEASAAELINTSKCARSLDGDLPAVRPMAPKMEARDSRHLPQNLSDVLISLSVERSTIVYLLNRSDL